MKGKLTLAGAGPGDPELITLKAVKALHAADVVLYDALVHPDLLIHAPEAERLFVGKRAGKHSFKQNEINKLILYYALKGLHVVRLKGGDPFVFGRGFEELAYAHQHGIAVSVIPGLSSATSLAGLQKVPLTHRGLNRSFWVLTATTQTGELSGDISLAAQSDATIVILMGRRKLAAIANIFARLGKETIPAMIIQSGSLPEEKSVVGTIETLAQQADEAGIGSPAIIIIGKTVSLHPSFLPFIHQLPS